MAVCMPDIVRSIVSCITSYQKKSTRNSAVLIAGRRPSCILLVMILWNALTAIIKWYSLNSISTINVYLSKKCTRTPCPVHVERGHLFSFFKVPFLSYTPIKGGDTYGSTHRETT